MDFNISSDSYIKYPSKRKFGKLLSSLIFYKGIADVIFIAYSKVLRKKYDSQAWKESAITTVKSAEKIGAGIFVNGINNFRNYDGPVVFISNHMSTLETFLFPLFIHSVKPACYIMKKELLAYPMFGKISGARFPIIVGRTNPREDLIKVLEEGKNRLDGGRSIIVFPQKTRSNYLDENSFNTIGIKLAQKNKVPVIPVAITTDLWSNGKIIRDIGWIYPERTINISFGEPIIVGQDSNEAHQKVIQFIKEKFVEWGREAYIIGRQH